MSPHRVDRTEQQMVHENIRPLPLRKIVLDKENPRLPKSAARSQKAMTLYIARNTSITELMTAIAENGYFPGEPIIIVPRNDNEFTVVEGNRRLTALLLLRDPSLYPRNARVREISESAIHRPDSVPCVIFPTRNDVVNYLGYRHISGVKQWEPLAKARYIAEYFVSHTDHNAEPKIRYQEVARGIGSRWPYIKRQLDGFTVYKNIEDLGFYDIDDLNEETISFSLLSTALGYDSILKYVSSTQHPSIKPDRLKPNAIRELTQWMYERNRDGETVLGESRNIKRLAIIVDDEHGLSVLKEYRSIQKAYAATKGLADDFNDLLIEIEWNIGQAVAEVALVTLDNSHRLKIFNIYRQARLLKRALESE